MSFQFVVSFRLICGPIECIPRQLISLYANSLMRTTAGCNHAWSLGCPVLGVSLIPRRLRVLWGGGGVCVANCKAVITTGISCTMPLNCNRHCLAISSHVTNFVTPHPPTRPRLTTRTKVPPGWLRVGVCLSHVHTVTNKYEGKVSTKEMQPTLLLQVSENN